MRRTCSLVFVLTWFALAPGMALAQTVVEFERSVGNGGEFDPGSTIDVTVTISVSTDEMLTAVGLEETLPGDFSYVSTVSGNVPSITPFPGKTGLLEFGFFPLPNAFPVSFTYRVAVPANATGSFDIAGAAIVRTLESGLIESDPVVTELLEAQAEVPDLAGLTVPQAEAAIVNAGLVVGDETTGFSFVFGAGLVRESSPAGGTRVEFGSTVDIVVSLGNGMFHVGDANTSGVIDFSELLRVIQLFNAGGYGCGDPEVNEDGYTVGPGTVAPCDFHDADTTPDGMIELTELVRIIQFFNVGAYHYCPDEAPATEDGFCVGV